jgi:hypothetical protein
MRIGLSLEDLSVRTKVSVELWDAMERNDFSRWPTGVAARSYIRSYAELVGVDPTATVDEFCRLVPNGDRRAERLVRGTAEFLGHKLVWSDDLPPALPEGDRRAPAERGETASGLPWWLGAHPRRVAAGIDLVAVVAFAGLVAGLAKTDFWVTLAVTALFYHGVSVGLLGCSPTVWVLDTYVSTQHPSAVPPVGVSAFRRLGLMRGDTPSPERDTAS